MAKVITLPQIGLSEESAVLARWHVSPGDTVKPGDLLFTLETGKASFDVEAEAGGTVLALYVEQGEEKPIQAPVCALGEPGETPPAVDGGKASAPAASSATPASARLPAPPPSAAHPVRRDEARPAGISPRARALAERAGVDAAQAAPSGAENRIIERDVRALIESGATPAQKPATAAIQPEYTDVPHSTIRKLIAANMLSSLQTLAQLTHHHSFDATAVQALRAQCKASGDQVLRGVTLGDMVLFAVARTLPDHPDLNAHFFDTHLRRFGRVGLGVAVDTPRGLMVPTIADADRKSLREISLACKSLAADAQAGKIDTSPTATFTVSNLGNLGVELFTPVINPPQTGILGVCGITYRPRADGSVYPAMGLSLTYDHRAVDGAPASRFLQDLCCRLENFTALLL